MINITYTSNIEDIAAENLEGFFVGWKTPLTQKQHFKHFEKCAHFVAALDKTKVVGFISALSDGVGCAFIPLLEVLPEYQKQGIGKELVRRMLDILKDIYAIDLICDEDVQGFYERFGMIKLSAMGLRRH